MTSRCGIIFLELSATNSLNYWTHVSVFASCRHCIWKWKDAWLPATRKYGLHSKSINTHHLKTLWYHSPINVDISPPEVQNAFANLAQYMHKIKYQNNITVCSMLLKWNHFGSWKILYEVTYDWALLLIKKRKTSKFKSCCHTVGSPFVYTDSVIRKGSASYFEQGWWSFHPSKLGSLILASGFIFSSYLPLNLPYYSYF